MLTLVQALRNRIFLAYTIWRSLDFIDAELPGTPEESYKLGWTRGFWKGVSAVLHSGLVKVDDEADYEPTPMESLLNQMH